ncbi:MAG TPA: alkaline phosphatase family protein [Nitrospiraceae bacterium]|nr:alkaline phosphatase family protein [Nitrospiraceae bacterium]
MNRNIPTIDKVFVLMLENRSFDHMLGFSGLSGTDVITGKLRKVNGLKEGDYFNIDRTGNIVSAGTGAPARLMSDPGHEFGDILEQLCGPGKQTDPLTGAYPKVTNAGFLSNYTGTDQAVMKCFGAGELRILETLAKEFAVCDAWYSSAPASTWPNRFFFHAASSGGMVESASDWAVLSSTLFQGYNFQHGTIFDLLDAAKIEWRIYEGDAFPQSFALKGMNWQWIRHGRFKDFSRFKSDVSRKDFSPRYVFIEPNYGCDILPPQDFVGGDSQHPIDDVFKGEDLIKRVYEAVRNSPHWPHSLLVITYDEHGGFYDHVAPPGGATAPGDAVTVSRQPRFDFKQYGVRVPTVIISPYTARNLVDSTVYDHTSFLRTLELLFDLPALTDRDAHAADFLHLLRSVQRPRIASMAANPRATIRQPKKEGEGDGDDGDGSSAPDKLTSNVPKGDKPTRTLAEAEVENQPLKHHHYDWLHVAFLRDLAIRQHDQREIFSLDQLRRDVVHIRTVGQARRYMQSVRAKVMQFKSRNEHLG